MSVEPIYINLGGQGTCTYRLYWYILLSSNMRLRELARYLFMVQLWYYRQSRTSRRRARRVEMVDQAQ